MKKVIVVLFSLLALSAQAQSFVKTSWNPLVGSTVEFSTETTTTYSPNDGFKHYFEGFAKSQYNGNTYYYVYTITCNTHVVSLFRQDNFQTPIISEYINPSHPVWAFRNRVCTTNMPKR